jgi:hypothetical protein
MVLPIKVQFQLEVVDQVVEMAQIQADKVEVVDLEIHLL